MKRIVPTLEELQLKIEEDRRRDKEDYQRQMRFLIACVAVAVSAIAFADLFTLWLFWR